jgi:hypothetical protein
MPWTYTKPPRPGWYWWSNETDGPRLVCVYWRGENKVLWGQKALTRQTAELELYDGEWQGTALIGEETAIWMITWNPIWMIPWNALWIESWNRIARKSYGRW